MATKTTKQPPKAGIKLFQGQEEGSKKTTENIKDHHFEIPRFKVSQVPSQGKVYPEDWEISYSPYSFGEIKFLNSGDISETDKFKYMLKGIYTSFPVRELTLFDFLYITLLRKISTLGEDIASFSYKCSNCKKVANNIIKPKDLQFEDIIDEDFPLVVNLSVGELIFYPLTVDNYMKLIQMKKHNDEVAGFAINVSNMEFEKAYEIIFNSVNPEDMYILDQVDELMFHGLKPVEVECKHCKAINHVSVEGGSVLINPFRESGESVKHAIRFGLSNES